MPSVSWISPPTPRGWLAISWKTPGVRDVAARHAQARQGHFRRQLLDDAGHVHEVVIDRRASHDAVAARVLGGHFLHGQDGARHSPYCSTICGDGLLTHHQVIGQQHGKGWLPTRRWPHSIGVAGPRAWA